MLKIEVLLLAVGLSLNCKRRIAMAQRLKSQSFLPEERKPCRSQTSGLRPGGCDDHSRPSSTQYLKRNFGRNAPWVQLYGVLADAVQSGNLTQDRRSLNGLAGELPCSQALMSTDHVPVSAFQGRFSVYGQGSAASNCRGPPNPVDLPPAPQ